MTSIQTEPIMPNSTLAAAGGFVEPTQLVEQSAPCHRRLLNAKGAYSTRFVRQAMIDSIEGFSVATDPYQKPEVGDVVVARVTAIGHHQRLEGPVSRRKTLFVDDEIIVAYGSRYAPDQFEAFIPDNLGPTNLVAAGGMASSVVSKHASTAKATSLQPIGLLTKGGKRVNLRDFAPYCIKDEALVAPRDAEATKPSVVLVFGSSMNAGKSETVARLVKGLDRAGLHVVAAKATGTGAGNDPNRFRDAGAKTVLDFTDFGYPATFRLPYSEIKSILFKLHAVLASKNPDVMVIEIADGLFQPDTAALIQDKDVQALTDRVVYASVDALGAVTGANKLLELGFDLAAVSGVLTASPLGAREAAVAVPVEVVNTFDLEKAEVAQKLAFSAGTNRGAN